MRTAIHYLLWNLGLAPPQTQTTAAERACIARHATGCMRAAEIGVWHGVTTAAILRAMAPEGELWAVDPYAAGRLGISMPERIAHRVVRSAAGARVRWIRTTGVEAAVHYEAQGCPPVEFVFIDGDHSYGGLGGDWRAWAPLVARGGRVALHDSRSTPARPIDDAGSARYTRDVILCDPQWTVADAVDSLTVVERL